MDTPGGFALIGLLLLVAGLGGAGWALLSRWRASAALAPSPRLALWALLAPGGTQAVLLDEGPYRHSRHPLLLSLALAAAGAALALQAPLLLLAEALVLAALARWWVPADEARQAQRFGGWWHDHAHSVPRWF